MVVFFHVRARALQRGADDVAEFDSFFSKLNFVSRDTAYIQEVVYKARQMCYLTVDHILCPLQLGILV